MAVQEDKFLGELRFGQPLTTTIQIATSGLCIFLGLTFLVAGPAWDQVGGVLQHRCVAGRFGNRAHAA